MTEPLRPDAVLQAGASLAERAKPILTQMIQIHGSPPFDAGASTEEVQAWRRKAYETPLEEVGALRRERLERDVYEWFGCRAPVSKSLAQDPPATFEYLTDEVALSLAEQRERLLDLVDEIIGALVERSCPQNKHFEDWDMNALASAHRANLMEDLQEPLPVEGRTVRLTVGAWSLDTVVVVPAEDGRD